MTKYSKWKDFIESRSKEDDTEDKQALRQKLDQDVQEFLARGGHIDQRDHGDTADADLSAFKRGWRDV